jgi:hypothetical protein
MAIYKTRWFARWARKEGLSDKALWGAVGEMVQGLFEADLGGDLLKKRIARRGKENGEATALPRTRAATSIRMKRRR